MSNVTPISQWKIKNKPTPLELPSGNTCLVQPVGMQAFITQGMIPNSLLGIIQKSLKAGQAGQADDLDMDEFMAEALQDPEKLRSIFDIADSVTVYCVVEPQVHPVPTDANARDPELLYVDEIDLDDKLFIFQYAVGGTRDLEPFRQATAGSVGPVSLVDLVQQPPESSP